ncbi:glycerol-3-phosphate acyltransferase 1, mitochondrial-like isoform X1 [Sycon ciliatum]|uniref:glycerol-3-phosphate acyltransferase 1, mitochondrial-like isoform X1 n=1 Tax=Sycon ciliatum TaxID=27933 RepID=UPI0031F64063
MDDEESNRRINDVYSKWEKKAPSLEDRVRATHNTGRSNAWENAFADHDVSAGRVERKMRQSKPRRRNMGGRGGGNSGRGGGGGHIALGALPPYAPKFAFDSGFSASESVCAIKHVFCGDSCTTCTAISKAKFTDKMLHLNSGHKNVLTVRPPVTASSFSHAAPYLSSAFSKHIAGSYPQVYKDVLASSRVKASIDQVVREEVIARNDSVPGAEAGIRRSVVKQAQSIAHSLSSSVSDVAIRCIGWLVYHVLRKLVTSLDIRYEEVKMLRKAMEERVPIVLLPTHRSHLDSLILLFVMFITEQQIPRTVAGDNLNLPLIATLFRNHGSFFIRRRLDQEEGKKDTLYRGILQEHIEQLLKQNQTLMFYTEGSRSRSGKVGEPKLGLMSVVVDAVVEGSISDIYLVPTSIAYDRTLESNSLASELMGHPKENETLWNTLCGLWRMLTGSIGQVRVNFGQPFSVNEYVRKQPHQLSQSDTGDSDSTQSSPAGGNTQVVSGRRSLVQSLGMHVRSTMERLVPAMSTHIVSCLLLTRFRRGVQMSQLCESYEWLENALRENRRDIGFTGSPAEAVSHACRVLSDVVDVSPVEIDDANCDEREDCFVTPSLTLPSVFQMTTCAAQILPSFLVESVMACSLHSMVYSSQKFIQNRTCEIDITQSELLTVAEDVCNLLRKEFDFTLPCQPLKTVLTSSLEKLMNRSVLSSPSSNAYSQRYRAETDVWDEEAEVGGSIKLKLKLSAYSRDWIQFFQSLLRPQLEIYWITTRQLCVLLDDGMEESKFVEAVKEQLQERLDAGLTEYSETVTVNPVRNAVKALLEDGTLVLEQGDAAAAGGDDDAPQLLFLAPEMCSQGAIDGLACSINDLMA